VDSEGGETVDSTTGTESSSESDEAVSDIEGSSHGVLDLTAGEVAGNNEGDTIVAQDNTELGTGPIIGIATAAVACLLCFLLIAGRRQNNGAEHEGGDAIVLGVKESFRKNGIPDLKLDSATTQHCGKPGTMSSVRQSDSSTYPSTATIGKRVEEASFGQFGSTAGSVLVRKIADAIDKANWDEVYRLASQLAEQEDLSTLSSIGKQNTKRVYSASNKKCRAHLSEEDLERTKTLDSLVESADWTGLAVTAALYAGEGGSSLYSSSKRSFLDIVAGKSGTSRAAAVVSDEDAVLRQALSSSSNIYPSALLGALTDETRSATTEECRAASAENGSDGSSSFYRPRNSSQAHNDDRRASSRVDKPFRSDPPEGAFLQYSVENTGAPSASSRATDTSLTELRERIDDAVGSSDWDKVSSLSSEVESNTTYLAGRNDSISSVEPRTQSHHQDAGGNHECSTQSLKEKLDQAVCNSDWAIVSSCANRMREEFSSAATEHPSLMAQATSDDPCNPWFEVGHAAARLNLSKSMDSSDSDSIVFYSSDSDSIDFGAAKRQTIHKLVKAGKWKGVSIMAGLYEMEFKASSTDDNPLQQAQEKGRSCVTDSLSPSPIDSFDQTHINETYDSGVRLKTSSALTVPRRIEAAQAGFRKVESNNSNSGKGAKQLVPYWEKPTDHGRGAAS
jgi:hypothetical protein